MIEKIVSYYSIDSRRKLFFLKNVMSQLIKLYHAKKYYFSIHILEHCHFSWFDLKEQQLWLSSCVCSIYWYAKGDYFLSF